MVALVAASARASIDDRIADIKEAIYRLALEDITEGVRAQRLRSLVSELHQVRESADLELRAEASSP